MKKINLGNLKSKKKVIIIGAVSLLVIIVVIIGIVMFLNRSNEKQLTNNMKELAGIFYEEHYWTGASSRPEGKEEFLGRFKELGIKVNLDNLSRYSNENVGKLVSEMKNNKTKKECDRTNTKVVIYPQEPYGKKDYKVDVTLDCGFKK